MNRRGGRNLKKVLSRRGAFQFWYPTDFHEKYNYEIETNFPEEINYKISEVIAILLIIPCVWLKLSFSTSIVPSYESSVACTQ